MYIVSKCLIGENCKYNGLNNETDWVVRFCETHNVCFVCPEVFGGLDTPRPPAERRGNKIINKLGKDVTFEYIAGAKYSLQMAKEKAEQCGESIEGAILKSKSPSCGRDYIYDGTFSSKLIEGNGTFVELLFNENINIITEKENIDDKL